MLGMNALIHAKDWYLLHIQDATEKKFGPEIHPDRCENVMASPENLISSLSGCEKKEHGFEPAFLARQKQTFKLFHWSTQFKDFKQEEEPLLLQLLLGSI